MVFLDQHVRCAPVPVQCTGICQPSGKGAKLLRDKELQIITISETSSGRAKFPLPFSFKSLCECSTVILPEHWQVANGVSLTLTLGRVTNTHRHPAAVGLAAGQNQRRGDEEWRRTGDAKEQICSVAPHRQCPCLYWKHCKSDSFFCPCSLHKLPFVGLVKDQAVAAASQPIENNNINYLHLGFDKEGWRHIYLQENSQSSLIYAICTLLKNI